MPFLYYLLKVVLCSGILTGYYWLALRNKPFHRWNRFYLLGAVVVSLIAPALQIQIGSELTTAPTTVLRLLRVVESDGVVEVERNGGRFFAFSTEQWLLLGYGLVSALLILIAAWHGTRIYTIIRSYPKSRFGDLYFLNTEAPGTPFSFFRYIVWNRHIDLASDAGQRILRHEVAHAEQRHTWDKLFLILMLIPFWINPFFWIIRRELHALHEFSADGKALGAQDAAALAQLILKTAFPKHHSLFINPFFQSLIKRRIAMFTKLKNPKAGYIGRIVALPVIAIATFAFAAKMKSPASQAAAILDNPITVVIDAGHGDKTGARIEGIYEDDIALAISKKIKEQNANANIRILLTRENEQRVDLKKRVEIASLNKADLFISIHLGAVPPSIQAGRKIANPANGMEVFVSSKNPPYQKQSVVLGSILARELGAIYKTDASLKVKQVGVWVLDKNVCPSVMIECGYLSNSNDLAFIKEAKNQKIVADEILNAITQYGLLKNVGSTDGADDTVPENLFGRGGFFYDNKQDITITADSIWQSVDPNLSKVNAKTALILINGKRFNSNDISKRTVIAKSLKFFEPEEALELYGEEGIHGAIVVEEARIIDKPSSELFKEDGKSKETNTKPIFTVTDIEPKFPDENGGWISFLQKNLNANVPVTKGAPPGTYETVTQFIVDKQGNLSEFKPLTKHGYGMEEEVIRLLKAGPDWNPAEQNGKKVTAYKKQKITFIVSE